MLVRRFEAESLAVPAVRRSQKRRPHRRQTLADLGACPCAKTVAQGPASLEKPCAIAVRFFHHRAMEKGNINLEPITANTVFNNPALRSMSFSTRAPAERLPSENRLAMARLAKLSWRDGRTGLSHKRIPPDTLLAPPGL